MLAVKRSHFSERTIACTVQLHRYDVYCPIILSISGEIRTVDNQSDLRILL